MLRIYCASIMAIRYRHANRMYYEDPEGRRLIKKYFEHGLERAYFIQLPHIAEERYDGEFSRMFDNVHTPPKYFFIPNKQFFLDYAAGELDPELNTLCLESHTHTTASDSKGKILHTFLESQHPMIRHLRHPREELHALLKNRQAVGHAENYFHELGLLHDLLTLLASSSTNHVASAVYEVMCSLNISAKLYRLSDLKILKNIKDVNLPRHEDRYVIHDSLLFSLEKMFMPSVIGQRKGDSFEDTLMHFFGYGAEEIGYGYTYVQHNLQHQAYKNRQLNAFVQLSI